jgi:succinate dehydrogenase / fumarate reductase cytochrome b subunit
MRYHPYHALVPRLDRYRLLRPAFSVSGVLPLGVFLVLHLAVNARVLAGDGAFAALADRLDRGPALVFIEAIFVFVPLALHGALGLVALVAREPIVAPSPYPPGIARALRATGAVALVFLMLHLAEVRFRGGGAHLTGYELVSVLEGGLSSTLHGVPLRAAWYVLAAGCVSFHFVAGAWGIFARSSAAAGRPAARRRAAWAAGLVGCVLVLGFGDVVVYYATGARILGGEPSAQPAAVKCP